MADSQIHKTYAASNPSDFRAIYNETFTLLYRVAWRVVNDEEAAEDLVHDSYIKASEKKMVFPSLDDAKFWLIRVVKNASLNYAKRKTREAKAYHKVLYESKKSSESADTALLKEDAKRIALEALNKLPKSLREVLILREYGDLNYKEIGKVLGITEGNVKIRMFRAREQLEKILEADDVYIS
ncbi:MAG: RNA polymerase sigma factor [Treponema sp.]|jgi:RNA polymerase sigma-70 factor (ECF subfamily)|uniref:RNA polymerase sigma factor n=1 Tax=Treponema sp. TaxID=166 RepID=UPI002A91E64A|nr:RNA polymerase sigma factor [Treponema sp.]MDY6396998.1 RNA polymerase sigma factor [Treponema sp.]